MTELVVIEQLNPVEVFANNGLEPLLQSIETKVRAFVPNMTTESGREAIRAIAFKVAKSKNALDKAGKDLTDDWRKKTSIVNAKRTIAWDRLEALQVEVRKPLTDWENTEKDRVAILNARLAELIALGSDVNSITTTQLFEEKILKANQLYQFNWQEFQSQADEQYPIAKTNLQTGLEDLIKYQAEQKELELLRKQQAEREQKEREERIAKEAAEKATRDAEEKAVREKQALIDAQAKAEAGKLALAKKVQEQQEQAARDKAEVEKRAQAAEAANKALQEKLKADAEAQEAKLAEAKKKAYKAGSYEEIIFNWGANNGYTFVTSEIQDLMNALGLKGHKVA